MPWDRIARRGDPGRLVGLQLVRLAFAATAVLAVVLYYVSPTARPAAVGMVGLLGVAAIAVGIGVFRPQRWVGWLYVGVAVALLAAGDMLVAVLENLSSGPVGYPGATDVFDLVAYLPLTVGLLLLGRPRLPSRDWALVLDTAGLSLAASLVVWIVLIRPAVDTLQLTGAGKVTAIASWVGYIAVLAVAARVFIAWRTNLSLALLAVAVGSFLAADFFYGKELISGTWATGGVIDLGYLAFGLLCGTAALTRSMAEVASPGLARHQLGPLRLAIIAIGLLVAPTALLVQATSGPVTTGVAIAVVSAAVGVLMLVRLYLTAQDYRRRARREHAVRMASRQLVVAASEDQVVAGVARAVTDVLPPGATSTVHLLHSNGGVQADHPNDLDAVVFPLGGDPQAPGPALVVRASAVDLAELDPVLHGLADQAASALQRISLFNDLQAEERERYFRTLVLTSDDVTLISRDGVVSYATPSARAMFGHDATGRAVDELIHREPAPPGWWATTAGAEATVLQGGDGRIAWVRSRDLHDDPTVAGVVTTLRDITSERRLQADLAYRASHDPLTGLANAQSFSDELNADDDTTCRALDRRSQSRAGRAALFIDLDDFKTVNDTYGHQTGDELLAEMAQRIQACLRSDDLAARLGGDEFGVLLRNVTDLDAARGVAQRIADALAAPATIGDIVVDSQASIGLAYTPGSGDTDALLRQADTALYSAKAMGKGQWRQYREGMPTPTRQHVEDRRRLEQALHQGRLDVCYQPIVDLTTAKPVGFEALIRLHDDPPMMADQIIAVAEDTGLIPSLGAWVLEQALAALPRLNPPGTTRPRYVSVNVSAHQLRQPGFVDTVRARIADAGANPELLVLEVTENLLIGDSDRVWTHLTDLRRDGVRVALDGAGYASLGYLRQPVFDIVKTDQSFLSEPTAPRNLILLQAVRDLCQRLQLDLVVEGIEDSASLRLAIAAGAQHGQGFHYAPALPHTEATTWHAHDADELTNNR